MKAICLETSRIETGDIMNGSFCSGKSCNKWETCEGRIMFDNLPKHTPTSYEIDEAVYRERLYNVK